MQTVLLVAQIIIALLLIGMILLQRSGSDGIQNINSSSGMGGIMSPASSASFLTKVTGVLAALFLINCLILSNLASRKHTILDKISSESAKVVTSHKKDLPIAE